MSFSLRVHLVDPAGEEVELHTSEIAFGTRPEGPSIGAGVGVTWIWALGRDWYVTESVDELRLQVGGMEKLETLRSAAGLLRGDAA